MTTSNLPKFEVNILKNMWVSCSNQTAKALSEMLNKKVKTSSISPKVLLINKIPKLLNPRDVSTTILYMQLIDTVKGVIVISSPLKNILRMADIFLRKESGYFKDLSDENIPVIKELASVLAGYYVTALNNSFGTNYELSEPFLSVNPYRAIEDFDFGPVYVEEIHVLMFKTSFNIAQEGIKKDIILLFREESTKELLEMISSKISFVKD